jgi:short subunit fatty acids transporter
LCSLRSFTPTGGLSAPTATIHTEQSRDIHDDATNTVGSSLPWTKRVFEALFVFLAIVLHTRVVVCALEIRRAHFAESPRWIAFEVLKEFGIVLDHRTDPTPAGLLPSARFPVEALEEPSI